MDNTSSTFKNSKINQSFDKSKSMDIPRNDKKFKFKVEELCFKIFEVQSKEIQYFEGDLYLSKKVMAFEHQLKFIQEQNIEATVLKKGFKNDSQFKPQNRNLLTKLWNQFIKDSANTSENHIDTKKRKDLHQLNAREFTLLIEYFYENFKHIENGLQKTILDDFMNESKKHNHQIKHDKPNDIPWDFKQDIKLSKIQEIKGTERYLKPLKHKTKDVNKTVDEVRQIKIENQLRGNSDRKAEEPSKPLINFHRVKTYSDRATLRKIHDTKVVTDDANIRTLNQMIKKGRLEEVEKTLKPQALQFHLNSQEDQSNLKPQEYQLKSLDSMKLVKPYGPDDEQNDQLNGDKSSMNVMNNVNKRKLKLNGEVNLNLGNLDNIMNENMMKDILDEIVDDDYKDSKTPRSKNILRASKDSEHLESYMNNQYFDDQYNIDVPGYNNNQ